MDDEGSPQGNYCGGDSSDLDLGDDLSDDTRDSLTSEDELPVTTSRIGRSHLSGNNSWRRLHHTTQEGGDSQGK